MVLAELADEKGRVVLKQNDKDRLIIGRYEDLDEKVKQMAIDIFCEETGSNREHVEKFMNFETDDNAFCS